MIDYPVPENSRWAVYSSAAQQILLRDQSWPRADGMELAGADPNLVMLRQIDSDPPSYNAALVALERTEIVDAPNHTLARGWALTPLPDAVVWAEQAQARKDREARKVLALPDSDDPKILKQKLNAALALLNVR